MVTSAVRKKYCMIVFYKKTEKNQGTDTHNYDSWRYLAEDQIQTMNYHTETCLKVNFIDVEQFYIHSLNWFLISFPNSWNLLVITEQIEGSQII